MSNFVIIDLNLGLAYSIDTTYNNGKRRKQYAQSDHKRKVSQHH